MKEIFTRRSIRQFNDKIVSDEIIIKALDAGMNAPSARAQRPWKFIVIKDKNIMNLLSTTSTGAKPCANANFVICTLMRKNDLLSPAYVEHDMGACTQNIMLELAHHNVGSVWIGGYPMERYLGVMKILDIEEGYVPFSLIACGYPKDDDAFKKLNNFDISRIRWM